VGGGEKKKLAEPTREELVLGEWDSQNRANQREVSGGREMKGMKSAKL